MATQSAAATLEVQKAEAATTTAPVEDPAAVARLARKLLAASGLALVVLLTRVPMQATE